MTPKEHLCWFFSLMTVVALTMATLIGCTTLSLENKKRAQVQSAGGWAKVIDVYPQKDSVLVAIEWAKGDRDSIRVYGGAIPRKGETWDMGVSKYGDIYFFNLREK